MSQGFAGLEKKYIKKNIFSVAADSAFSQVQVSQGFAGFFKLMDANLYTLDNVFLVFFGFFEKKIRAGPFF